MSVTFGKGSRQKKKRCVKATAYPCKFACINKEKTCRNGLEGQAKTWTLWLKDREDRLAKVNAHRGSKGRSQFSLQQDDPRRLSVKLIRNDVLALRNKQKADPYAEKQSKIDAKYASSDPSERDINRWLAESIRLNAERTTENITRLASIEILTKLMPYDYRTYAPFVFDEDSFVKVYTANQQRGLKREIEYKGQRYNPDSIEYWMGNLEYNFDYENAQKDINNPRKGEKAKAKARQVIDRVDKQRAEEHPAIAQRQLDNYLSRLKNDNPREQYRELITKYKKDVAETINDFHGQDYDKKERARNRLEGFTVLSNGIPFLNEHFRDTLGVSNQTLIKEYLIGKSPDNIANQYLKNPRTKRELKRSFKDFALKNHPDKGGDVKLFQAVSARYQEKLKELPM